MSDGTQVRLFARDAETGATHDHGVAFAPHVDGKLPRVVQFEGRTYAYDSGSYFLVEVAQARRRAPR